MEKVISIRISEEQDDVLCNLVKQAKKEYIRKDITKSTIIRQLIDKASHDSMIELTKKLSYYNNIVEDLKNRIKDLRTKKLNAGDMPEEIAQLLET